MSCSPRGSGANCNFTKNVFKGLLYCPPKCRTMYTCLNIRYFPPCFTKITLQKSVSCEMCSWKMKKFNVIVWKLQCCQELKGRYSHNLSLISRERLIRLGRKRRGGRAVHTNNINLSAPKCISPPLHTVLHQ